MNGYVAIRSEGGLIPFETIEKIVRKELAGQADVDFALERGKRLSDEIARAWSDVLDYWHIFRRRMEALSPQDPGTTLTRERWVLPLLTDLLGYRLTYQAAGAQIGDKTYPISHRAGEEEEAPRVHIVGFRQDLDRRDETGRRRMSPHALVQEYVNRSEHVWAIVTNGLQFRLLRDTTRTARPTYLEFDLQSILEGGRFSEFATFYRLCHRTRLPKTIAGTKDCWLEQYFQESIDEGLRIRDRLREAVEVALKRIATGLLQHPSNGMLRQKVGSGQLMPDAYYRQLLRLVYRLLFLMVAEERQMLLVPGTDAERRLRIYDRFYSIRRLRDVAERPVEESLHHDLWTGLQETFRLFTNGRENTLGMPPLNGQLFGPEAIPDLEGTHLYNHVHLLAVRRMSVFETGGAPARVNYAGLDVEELGSVYESLLDFHPVIEEQNGDLVFELRTGTERKSTGSYYTPRELVSELIDSALIPVLEDRLAKAKTQAGQEQAILTMTVCDPACGSGHFLLAAARRMARELDKVRTGEDEPTPEGFRRALRDVIQHCVYGVDKNPLAVDLCKVALWIEGHNPGLPLSFLDHRIKCGNSLVGLFSLEKIAEGIPDDAYAPAFGDDKEVAKALRKRNARERKSQGHQLSLIEQHLQDHVRQHATDYATLGGRPQDTAAHVHEMEHRYREIHGQGSSWWRDWVAANLWTTAFFVSLTDSEESHVPTTDYLRDWVAGITLPPALLESANGLASDLRLFHWSLEYPEVLTRGGFDVVLSNPPWERIRLQESEFFASRAPAIAEARTKAERAQLIEQLAQTNPSLWNEFSKAKHLVDAQDAFIRGTGRFPFSASGDINTYALFAEMCLALINSNGRSGIVAPTGLATDATYARFFDFLVRGRILAMLYDFENRHGLFPSVHRQTKFCLLTISRSPVELGRFAFFAHSVGDLQDDRRVFEMRPSDLAIFNPNTGTLPVFRTRHDAELARKVYSQAPVFVNHASGTNAWGVVFRRMFHMSDDSHLFRTRRDLERDGFTLIGNVFSQDRERYLPLYEGKMFNLFDHRAGTFEGVDQDATSTELPSPTLRQLCDPRFAVYPRYWINEREAESRIAPNILGQWLIAFRDFTNATNERTAILSVIPIGPVGNNAPLLYPGVADGRLAACLLGNLCALVFDFFARQKVGGTHLSYFLLEQLPVLPPSSYAISDQDFLVRRLVELVYTAWDVQPWAGTLGFHGPPFSFDYKRRALLQSEVDAYYAHLYNLSRDELRYILDPKDVHGEDFPGESFRVLREREEREHGEFRTRRLVLEAFDELAKGSRFGGRVSAVITYNR